MRGAERYHRIVSSSSIPALVQSQRTRLPLAQERARTKLESLVPDPSASALLKAAQKARTTPQRVVWLQRAASAWARPMEAVAACRAGCSHCCQIAVTISHVEAQLIAKATGRQVHTPARSVRVADEASIQALAEAEAQLHTGPLGPCPLLQDDRCSVYEHRPLACRTLLNLDDDDLLCRHVPGHSSDVPYANAMKLKGIAVLAQAGAIYADIREFFPPA